MDGHLLSIEKSPPKDGHLPTWDGHPLEGCVLKEGNLANILTTQI